jgi:phospholipid transport system substrate-binding protein
MTTFSYRITTVLCFFALVSMMSPAMIMAQNPQAEIRALLTERDQDIKALLGSPSATLSPEREARLRAVVNDIIDFEVMGEAALGSFWEPLTAAQRTDFTTVFADIVRAQSLADLDVYRSSVSIQAIEINGAQAVVSTQTTYQGITTPVVYKMVKQGNLWQVWDIILDDVSTVDGYARSFQAVVRRRGFDTLMESLRRKQASL